MQFSLKISIFYYIYLVDKINNWYHWKFKENFQLATLYWSKISSLLQLNQFYGGRGLQYANTQAVCL